MSCEYFEGKYAIVEMTYENELEYPFLNELLLDFCQILRSVDLYKSDDTSKEDYDKDVRAFAKKWLKPKYFPTTKG